MANKTPKYGGSLFNAVNEGSLQRVLRKNIIKTKKGPKGRDMKYKTCDVGYHGVPAWTSRKDWKHKDKKCVKTCAEWNPTATEKKSYFVPGVSMAVKGRRGICKNPGERYAKQGVTWMEGLRNFYNTQKQTDPEYNYKTAMKDYSESEEWRRIKARQARHGGAQ